MITRPGCPGPGPFYRHGKSAPGRPEGLCLQADTWISYAGSDISLNNGVLSLDWCSE